MGVEGFDEDVAMAGSLESTWGSMLNTVHDLLGVLDPH
jgi:hypothetical protein